MPIAFLLALLIVWPVAELYLMIEVSRWLGFFWMLFLLFASAVAGILVLQHRGRKHWQRFRTTVAARRPPAREAFDGVMVTVGAFLLIVPGFLTTALGLLALLPPTRFLVRILLVWMFASRFRVVGNVGARGTRWYYAAGQGRQKYDVEGEAVDVTDRPRGGDGIPRLPSGFDDESTDETGKADGSQ